MIVTHGDRQFDVGDKVGETPAYRMYLCSEVGSDTVGLLQVARGMTDNGGLDRAAFVLRELERKADLYETEYARRGGHGLLSYDRLFPFVLDSFIPDEQGGRRVTVLAFREVDDSRRMVPLSNLRERDHVRVSLRSSAWIMGRLLKLLAFTHGEKISVGLIGTNNVLIEPDRHFALVFDWSGARTYSEDIPGRTRKDDIAKAASTVLSAIGVTADGGYPYAADEDEARYVGFITDLARHPTNDASIAHDRFYDLVERLWGRTFIPFTTLPV